MQGADEFLQFGRNGDSLIELNGELSGAGSVIVLGALPGHLLPEVLLLGGLRVIRVGFHGHGAHFLRRHAREPVGDPGIGYGDVVGVADSVIEPAGLGGEFLPVRRGVDLLQIELLSARVDHAGLPQASVGVSRVRGHHLHGKVVPLFAKVLGRIRQNGEHLLRPDIEAHFFKLPDSELFLNIQDGNGVIEVEDSVRTLRGIIGRAVSANVGQEFVQARLHGRIPVSALQERQRGGLRRHCHGQDACHKEHPENDCQISHTSPGLNDPSLRVG